MTQFASTLYPQTNPSNPILLELRMWSGSQEAIESLLWHLGHLDQSPYMRLVDPNDAQIDHARRVLTRLANFTG